MRSKPLILNIDDDEAGRYVVDRTLRQAGYDVSDAGTGLTGFNLALSSKPDLILLDIRLPDIDGFEVCRRIREVPEISNTPIVQMSASLLDSSSQVKGLNSGADAYLTEPTEPLVLIATVNSMLRMKRAEQTVLRAAQTWQSTFEAIGDGVAVLDGDGKVVQRNGTFQELEGIAPAVSAAFTKLLMEPARTVEEIQSAERVLAITLDPTFDASGEVAGAVCIVSDVTERKRFEEQFRESARLESLGVMAGGIAHDFNNLLTGILGNASLLAETAGAEDRAVAAEIVFAAERAAELTKQMLAYSGKGRFVVEVLDLNNVIHENLALLRATLQRSVTVDLELNCSTCCVEADRAQIQQIVMNLLLNASEAFNEAAGRVIISTDLVDQPHTRFSDRLRTEVPAGKYALLEVRDNGSGMQPETLKRIFDPFFTTKFTGRGLGLAAVLGIVRGHHGDIEVTSTPGMGTTFRVMLPATNRSTASREESKPIKTKQSNGQLILVVDDEDMVRRMATTALESRGFRVLVAADGSESLDVVRNNPDISLIILDLNMPVMTGEQAIPLLRSLRPDLRIIVSSGFGETEITRRFGSAGIDGVLQKPYSVSDILSAVGEVLEQVL